MSDIKQEIEAIKKRVKHGKLKIQRKKIKDQVLKDVKPEDRERDKICKKAREKAHTVVANTKRDMSNEVRKHLNTLSEGFDFIEESCGTGYPEFTFYEEPKVSEAVSESFGVVNNDFHTIGVAEGVFAPIGVMSRNNRIYDEDHYDCILSDERLLNKIQNRGMLGTIGHYDKRVDDEDLAEGKVSHIVTDLHIVEEADGTRNLYGKLEIMNTPAGNLLKTYYEHGVPLYVSSRGAGKLLNVPNESYKRVDKTSYFLETFDIVKDPGFLQAKPNYVKESVEEDKQELQEDNTIHQGDDNMAKKTVPAIDAEMDAQELINKLLNPLKEQIADLTETVKQLSEKVLDVEEETVAEEVSESVEEVTEAEVKKETEDDESEKKADVAESVEEVKEAEVTESQEEVVEEKCEDDKEEDKAEEKCDEAVEETEEVVVEAEVKKETEDDESEKKADVAESVEEVVEEKCEDDKEDEKAEECDEAKKDEEAEKLVADAEVDDAKADKLEKDAEKDEEKCDEAKEDLEADKKEDEAKAKELKADAEEDREDAEEIKEEATEEVVEEKCEDKEDDKKEDEEPVEESVDYEAKYKETEKVMNDLVKMVSEASDRCKATVEKYEAVCKELNAYKLSEELAITIDEAKEKLETKSYEEIKEEASQEVVEEVAEEIKEEAVVEETVAESKKSVKPVFSRFAGLSESKKSGKKGFSIFG